ncbi:hypothetical protein MWU75_13120 [Ornithinimicrobium sp. F0845]|uniref:hypothetical protein n=1 Tax=Ornithinimicrobium sp. F0845 TaxID=2926412 RepID=UPI001FF182E0|nr:hypothetical protein [Ornithinimicrobium sp. F0845]MCK0113085.1 hypothetical protein [Ornithinimicrobium sp. F0845]
MRPELLVPGPRWSRVATDALAVGGVASIVAAFWWDAVAVALFALVLLGLTVPRVARLPGPLQVATGATILLGAWAAVLDWYVALPHLDLVVHALANGLLAAAAVLAMPRVGMLPPRLPASGLVVLTTGLGALLGVLWEAGEWLGHTWINDAIQVGYDDTVGDLVAGVLGSAAAGVALAVGRSRD